MNTKGLSKGLSKGHSKCPLNPDDSDSGAWDDWAGQMCGDGK
tara:strand:+ start:421 stop:546 length:126 start_codon:yes stop_codon:yes gene_type:complete